MLDVLVAARGTYAYPPVGLVEVDRLRSPETWEADLREHRFDDTLALDAHHHALLRSDDDARVTSGVLSVVYWGNVTGRGLAPARTRWAATGKAGRAEGSLTALGFAGTADVVREATEHLDRGHLERAVLTMVRLPYVGPSFSTKLLAFLDPERVGVLDGKLSEHLGAGTFAPWFGAARTASLAPGRTESTPRFAARFARFVELLSETQGRLNEAGLGWRDTSGASLARFRAVDVERALFARAVEADGRR